MLSVDHWNTNGELIADVWKMYVEPRWPEPRCMDVTYGRGKWWTHVDPPQLVKHDIRIDGVDFRSLPHDNGTFDAVFFDPDYIAPGGRKTSTIPDFNDRYGLKPEYETPYSLEWLWIFPGLSECLRVTDNHGLVFIKCADYITSGKLWRGVEHITLEGERHPYVKLYDKVTHVSGTGPQPGGRRHLHARSNSSVLLVFRKGGRRKKAT
jgi:hypothetical protein